MRSNILKRIRNIDPSNHAVNFISERIQRDDYRGIQLSQHNRYDMEVLSVVLMELYSTSGDSLLQIRSTDLSKRPYNIDGEEKYAELVTKIHRKIGRSTQDSLRKNLFVDFNRAGFIDRYDKNKEYVEPFRKINIKYVKISEMGKRFINAENHFQKYLIFSEGLNNLLKDLINNLMIIISSEVVSNRKISIEEFMYIISFIGKEVDGRYIDIDQILYLLSEYRRLPAASKEMLKQLIISYCNPSFPSLSKLDKRDHHNWKNESTQILKLLNQTSYFKYSDEEYLTPRVESTEISPFETVEKFIRSAEAKREYFNYHKINKQIGFELHHTIPVSFAKTKEQFYLIDDWKNLLYIDGYKHAIISQMGSNHYILKANDNDLELKNAVGHVVDLNFKENVIYNIDLLNVMLNYNANLRQSIMS